METYMKFPHFSRLGKLNGAVGLVSVTVIFLKGQQSCKSVILQEHLFPMSSGRKFVTIVSHTLMRKL